MSSLLPSRIARAFDPSEHCVAPLLDSVTDSVRLGEMLPEGAAALDRYGKALDPGYSSTATCFRRISSKSIS